jgi:hypothetical protein
VGELAGGLGIEGFLPNSRAATRPSLRDVPEITDGSKGNQPDFRSTNVGVAYILRRNFFERQTVREDGDI